MPEPIDVQNFLLELLRGHGVAAETDLAWIRLPKSGMRTQAAIVSEDQVRAGVAVRLDVRFEFEPGTILLESFGGVGEDREQAVKNTLHGLSVGTFHVLLTAFLGGASDQVTDESWIIGGQTRRVITGPTILRGTERVQRDGPFPWFPVFEERMKTEVFGPETHWIRVYLAQLDGQRIACEVLRDNEEWTEMQKLLSATPLPPADGFYSLRTFLVIPGRLGDPPTPQRAVTLLAELAAADPEITDEAIFRALAAAGVPGKLANKALVFTQIAWGRILLERLPNFTFSPDYVVKGWFGKPQKPQPLAGEPCFVAANRLRDWYIGTPAFGRIGASSAEVQAINNAVTRGAKLEDGGKMSPPVIGN